MPNHRPVDDVRAGTAHPRAGGPPAGISRWKLYDLLRREELVSVRIGSSRRIPARAIEDLIVKLLRDQSGSPPLN